ncbi:outer membrane beta-barrel protein [Shewanella surugensis]|uniref:Outer membrane beta-barrel protein n=1 Tax=Shewanella surugensis TaxID=212020 RepID=A0ABT0LCA5_9GAMM|nr:outer membrane beta-barrel protein [Shewanella surugensis]
MGADIAHVTVTNEEYDIFNKADESNTSLGLYTGYNFSDWFGIEANYYQIDFSDMSYGEDNGFFAYDVNIKQDASVFSLAPIFSYAFDDTYSIYTKVGINYMFSRQDISGEMRFSNSSASSFDTKFDYSGIGYVIGAGLRMAVTESLNIRFAYEFVSTSLEYDDDNYDDYSYDDIDVNVSRFSLGMHYQF